MPLFSNTPDPTSFIFPCSLTINAWIFAVPWNASAPSFPIDPSTVKLWMAVLKCAFANFCYAGAFFYNDFQHISRVFKGIVTDEEIRTRKRNIFYGRIIKGPVFSHGLTYLSLLDISILFYHIFLFLATGSFHRLLRLVSSMFDDYLTTLLMISSPFSLSHFLFCL